MDNNEFTQNQNPVVRTSNAQRAVGVENTPEKKLQMGPIIGSVIVVILLILGGLYFIGKRIGENETPAPLPQVILDTPDSALEALGEQNTSDEINSIQSDLDATPIDELDAELGNIEVELGF